MTRPILSLSILATGLLFGAGMTLSGMIDPAKVIGFLNIAGEWDPSLAFVMLGALAVYTPAYHLWLKQRSQTLSGESYCLPINKTINVRLIFGAVLFGIGWGLAGICPGPAMASLGFANLDIVIFIIAMLVGSQCAKHIMPD